MPGKAGNLLTDGEDCTLELLLGDEASEEEEDETGRGDAVAMLAAV